MVLNNINKTIKQLRIEAGYTQRELAEILCVSDKAVSKWENGKCYPDISILPKLSNVLNTDLDYIVTSSDEYNGSKWRGLLVIEDKNLKLDKKIYDKPMIDYLLSYFMLANITDITIKTNKYNEKFLSKNNYNKYGLKIRFAFKSFRPVMVIYEPFLLFGSNLTRSFHFCMDSNCNMQLKLENSLIPICFNSDGIENYRDLKDIKFKELFRGMVYIPLKNSSKIKEASDFVRVYQNNHKYKISDLKEIANNRMLLKR